MKRFIAFALFLITTNLSFAQESLKIVWLEQYEWKLLSNQEDGNIHMMEVIPGKETAENWTMLGQMMSIKGALNVPMEDAKNTMFEQIKASFPKAKLTVLEKDEQAEFPWILFKIEKPDTKLNQKAESQLWYIRQGKTALYINFIAKKEKELKADFVETWVKVFKDSEIVEIKKEAAKEEAVEEEGYYLFYEYKYIDSTGQDITTSMGEEHGLEQHYFINGRDYVAFDEAGTLQQLYHSKDNKYYFVVDGELKVISADLAYPAIPSIETSAEKIKVLAYACNAVVFLSESKKTTYYFSKDISINPEIFKAHRFGNWATYLKQSNGGLALKIVTEHSGYTQIIEAIKVEKKKIAQKRFEIKSYIE